LFDVYRCFPGAQARELTQYRRKLFAQKMFLWGPKGARPVQEDGLVNCLTFTDVLLGPKGAHPVPKETVA